MTASWPLDPEQQRTIAAKLNGLVWMLLEKPDRTSSENDRLEWAAYASLYHWSEVGTPKAA